MALHSSVLPTDGHQAASSALLVRPSSFGFNAHTAASNAFQSADALDARSVSVQAQVEFDRLSEALRAAGVRCCVVDDTPQPPRPDAVFPNNWCSWHADGTLVLYPLLAESRRPERREAIIDAVVARTGFRIRRRIDLTPRELSGQYLEGTGSLVLDHLGRVAYACRSPRTDEALFREWCALMHYEPVFFDAHDASGLACYHTNVMLWIGTRCAMVCLEAIDPSQREWVRRHLSASRELLTMDRHLVGAFAGNMLELRGCDTTGASSPLLLMSAAASAALPAALSEQLHTFYERQCVVAVPTIERVGGGSVRCMVAEVPDTTAS